MDSIYEPSNSRQRAEMALSLAEVRDQIHSIQSEYADKGIPLSNRVIHAVHYLPVQASLASRSTGALTPPLTPPIRPADAAPTADAHNETQEEKRWSVTHRWGHSAMISGILSLADESEQVLVGWVGDVVGTGSEKVPLTDADRSELEALIKQQSSETDGEEKKAGGAAVSYEPVWLADDVAHGHYDGYCKTTLWPLFHYLLWQDIDASTSSTSDNFWPSYVAANEAYAKKVAAVYKPGDLVWVHDYHLLLVPQILRTLIPDAVVGLFVHTPFPSSEIFRCLPKRREVLDGMLGANLVVFQTYSYARHFTSSCIRVCGYETAAKGIDNQGHITTVAHCPVGVDAERIMRDSQRPGIEPKRQALRDLYEGKKIIVARDKLDVVKGIVQKLRAFERLLRDYPEWIGNVVLIQVTTPALTDSPKLERQVSEIVAHINGEYGSLDFIPVHHYHQTIKKDEFYALLSVADLAVITPLRDGMNTTSMEFVIAQDKTNKSPIVLSEFMGISTAMEEALQVNPWDLGGVAAAINHGLVMSDSEKSTRHAKLYKSVTTHTSHVWAAMLVRMLLAQIGREHTAHNTPFLDRELMLSQYKSAKKRLFLFDYDGTLTPIVKTPSAAVPPTGTLRALAELSADPKNVVFIISGRDGAFLEQHLGHLENVGFSAEHGGFIRKPGSKEWSNLTEELDMSWMSEVEEIFKYYTERTTGSHIEIKKSSITWHYRSSDPEWGLFQCRQCQDLLENNLAHKRPIEVLVGKKNLEVRPLAVNKGEIVKRILYENPDAEFIFCAGDDKTDEDMFRALAPYTHSGASSVMEAPIAVSKNGTSTPPVELSIRPEGVFSVAVGSGSKKTLASWHVTSPFEVIDSVLALVDDQGPSESVRPDFDLRPGEIAETKL